MSSSELPALDMDGGSSAGAELLSEMRSRLTEIQRRLDRLEQSADERDRVPVRESIMSLHGEVDRLLEELGGLREEIRPLVARYRSIFPRRAAESGDAGPAQAGRGDTAVSRIDHLGSSTYRERGWTAIAGGDYERALREIERALELAPGDPEAESLLGWAYMRLDRLTEAETVLRGVLEKHPDHALTQASLGYVLLREGRFAESIEMLSVLLRGTADRKAQLYANLYLGMVYGEREMYRDARTFFERALELGPNLIEAQWEMGRTHFLEGSADLALQVWRQGAEANRFSPWGEMCMEAVQRLEGGGAPGV